MFDDLKHRHRPLHILCTSDLLTQSRSQLGGSDVAELPLRNHRGLNFVFLLIALEPLELEHLFATQYSNESAIETIDQPSNNQT